MTTVQLRKKVHSIIDTADERLLKMIYAMTKEYGAAGEEWMAEEEAIAYERIQAMKSGKVKGLSLEETVKKAKASIRK